MKLEIKLRPLESYFLGSERCAPFGEYLTQRSLQNPYFLRSNQTPAQSALFGVLRYLGIQNPQADYSIKHSEANIGPRSFDLLAQEPQSFGKIRSIGALMLADGQGRHYLPAPMNHRAVEFKGEKTAVFQPYQVFTTAWAGPREARWLPQEYSEKDQDQARFLCIETGELIASPFGTHIRVGINRTGWRKADAMEQGGFFKRECVFLKEGFSFVFQAEVEDDFWFAPQRTVWIGQGQSPFAATVEKIEAFQSFAPLGACFPKEILLDGKPCPARYALAVSDVFFDGELTALKERCRLMLAGSRDYRVFTTNYQAANSKQRYRKHPEVLRLFSAGSVFLCSDDGQMEQFREILESGRHFESGKTAGFNQLYYSGLAEGGAER